VQDALMVSYLSHLTQAQMKLAERIAALSSSSSSSAAGAPAGQQ
jgi:hypothetical protein